MVITTRSFIEIFAVKYLSSFESTVSFASVVLYLILVSTCNSLKIFIKGDGYLTEVCHLINGENILSKSTFDDFVIVPFCPSCPSFPSPPVCPSFPRPPFDTKVHFSALNISLHLMKTFPPLSPGRPCSPIVKIGQQSLRLIGLLKLSIIYLPSHRLPEVGRLWLSQVVYQQAHRTVLKHPIRLSYYRSQRVCL